jgi:hypothetical protein
MAIEPLYTLKVAAELIPMTSHGSLKAWLSQNDHLFPEKRYRNFGPYGRSQARLLSESEILMIRRIVIKPVGIQQRRRAAERRESDWRANLLRSVLTT